MLKFKVNDSKFAFYDRSAQSCCNCDDVHLPDLKSLKIDDRFDHELRFEEIDGGSDRDQESGEVWRHFVRILKSKEIKEGWLHKLKCAEIKNNSSSDLRSSEFDDYFPPKKLNIIVDSSNFHLSSEKSSYDFLKSKEMGSTEERGLFELIWRDDRSGLVSLCRQKRETGETIDQSLASRLFHFACKLDSVECAAALLKGECAFSVRVNSLDEHGRTPLHNAARAHSVRSIELLLPKSTRTDCRSKDGDNLTPLEVALSSKRHQVDWTPNETTEELLDILGRRDLSAVRLLVEKTEEVPKLAYDAAMEGGIVALASLLMVDADRITAPIVLLCAGPRVETTIYESVIRETIALGHMVIEQELPGSPMDWREKRKVMLCEIELLQMFGAVVQGNYRVKKMVSPLMSACEAGDEEVAGLLLNTKIDVNDADRDGNSALHWCLGAKDLKLRELLTKLGDCFLLSRR